MESYRILVIEDDPAIGQSLLDGFRQHGFQAQLCKTGSSGIESAQKQSSHLIVLDIRLPEGSGFDVCHQLTLIVSDSGIGIPPEDLPNLFERFHRGRNVSEYPGNGLGLAIVKAIVNAHQGDVAVQSEQGQGTSISVLLPTV